MIFWKSMLYNDTIDAVTTWEWAESAYATRVDFEMKLDFKYRYLLYYGRYSNFFGKGGRPEDLRVLQTDTSLTSWRKTH
jgi:hypothetical protein